MELNTIIVNASAAKTGGAETIIDTFIDYIENDISGNRYIILSPKEYKTKNSNIVSIKKSTHSINTFLFTTLFIYRYCLKYKATRVLSFNNVNLIFPVVKRITYFHQPKDLKDNYSGVRKTLYYFIIKYFLHNESFIVQSELIKELFIKRFGFSKDKVVSVWPGFKIPDLNKIETSKVEQLNKEIFSSIRLDRKIIGICPIAYNGNHKNLNLLFEFDNYFNLNKACVLSLLDVDNDKNFNSIKFIGKLKREELFLIYEKVDFVFFPSLDETVGLPIFEFLQTGKIAFVYEADYAKSYYEQFNRPQNFVLFNEYNFKEKFKSNIGASFSEHIDYSRGEWEKIDM